LAANESESAYAPPAEWWTALGDPGIDQLVRAALSDSPTLDEVEARSDEAFAALGGARAQQLPSITAGANANRQRNAGAVPGETALSRAVDAGIGLAYEIDLFGRVRESVKAARYRSAARSADVDSARLTLVAQIADSVVALRACAFSQQVRSLDMASRSQVLDLTLRRVAAGRDARLEASRASSSLANARTEAALQQQECNRQAHALHALTGLHSEVVRTSVLGTSDVLPMDEPPFIPTSPALPPALPATVLGHHPDLLAADRDAAAAWSEVGVAKAERLPRIDVSAILTGNWLRAAGSTLEYTTWAFGTSLTAPLFDGGSGASRVNAAEARYRAADARLRQVVRRIVQDVEQAMALEESSRIRAVTSREARVAARDTFLVTEQRWRAGATNLFELEDARRQRAAAEDAAIAAARDQAQAWIALMKAIGTTTPSLPKSDNS
jgi:NodT family efflux transporter outer membrane factor (OMF) lipoprotein